MFKKTGGEFLVNTTTERQQSQSDVTALENGGFAVTWMDSSETGGDTSLTAVRAQVFDANGVPQGGEMLVNSTTSQGQGAPSITGLADGGFVVTWTDSSQSGGDTALSAVRGQMFNADGTPRGGEILLNTLTENNQLAPDVAALADGGFVAAWEDRSAAADPVNSSGDVRAQIFAADGAKVGQEFLVNQETSRLQASPSIVGLDNGNFAVLWDDNSNQPDNPDSDGSAVRARLFGPDGAPLGDEFLVNQTTADFQLNPDAAQVPGGGFVVAWGDTGVEADGTAVRARLFGPDGAPQGDELLISDTTSVSDPAASVAALAGGTFMVTWSDSSQSGSDTSLGAVMGQTFAADGTPQGEPFVVNTATTNFQGQPAVAALDGGRFVATFTDGSRSGLDDSSDAVKGQILGPDADGDGDAGATVDFLGLSPEQQVSAVYVAYFGRAPGPEGLDFWVGQRAEGLAAGESAGAVLDDIAESFRTVVSFPVGTPENTEGVDFGLFRDPETATQGTVSRFVNEVFNNLFNRNAEGSADDPTTGLGFWTQTIQDRLSAGVNIGDIMVDIISGAQGTDAVTVTNKIDAGIAFAEAFQATDGAAFEVEGDRQFAVETIRAVNDTDLAVTQATAAAQRFAEDDAAETQPVVTGIAPDAAALDGFG